MKIFVLAAAAALLASPVLAQSPAVQGRTGSSAGGYQEAPANQATGGTPMMNNQAPATTGSTQGTSGGMMMNQSGQPQGTTTGNAPPVRQQ